MKGTIVQQYGPIYGEPVNGTVFGRPNGSVYVPPSNTIDMTPYNALVFPPNIQIRETNKLILVNAQGNYRSINLVAQSQDLASYMETSVYSDAQLTQKVGSSKSIPAGQFNRSNLYDVGRVSTETLTQGAKYYVIAQLMNNGVPIATSTTLEVTAL